MVVSFFVVVHFALFSLLFLLGDFSPAYIWYICAVSCCSLPQRKNDFLRFEVAFDCIHLLKKSVGVENSTQPASNVTVVRAKKDFVLIFSFFRRFEECIFSLSRRNCYFYIISLLSLHIYFHNIRPLIYVVDCIWKHRKTAKIFRLHQYIEIVKWNNYTFHVSAYFHSKSIDEMKKKKKKLFDSLPFPSLFFGWI